MGKRGIPRPRSRYSHCLANDHDSDYTRVIDLDTLVSSGGGGESVASGKDPPTGRVWVQLSVDRHTLLHREDPVGLGPGLRKFWFTTSHLFLELSWRMPWIFKFEG